MLLPKVDVMGIPAIISFGMATGLEHKLHVIKREFTAEPIGVRVESTEMFALVADGNVPVANPIMLLNVDEELLNVIWGVVAVAGYPANPEGAEYPDGKEVGTTWAMSWTL
jgi:hypothetical protein